MAVHGCSLSCRLLWPIKGEQLLRSGCNKCGSAVRIRREILIGVVFRNRMRLRREILIGVVFRNRMRF